MKIPAQLLRACLLAAFVQTSLSFPQPPITRPCDPQDGCGKTRIDEGPTETDSSDSSADWHQDHPAPEHDKTTAYPSHQPAQDSLVRAEFLKSLQQIHRRTNRTKQWRQDTRRRKAKLNRLKTIPTVEAVTPTNNSGDEITKSDFITEKTVIPTPPNQPTPNTSKKDVTFDVQIPDWLWLPHRTLPPWQDSDSQAAASLNSHEKVQADKMLSVDTNFGVEILPPSNRRIGSDHTSLITRSEQDLMNQLTLWSKLSLEPEKPAYLPARCHRDLETRTTYYKGRPCPRQARPELTDHLCHARRLLAPNGCCKEWWVVCN